MNPLTNRQPWTAGTCPRFGCAMRRAGPGECFHRAVKAASCRRSPKSRCSIPGSWSRCASVMPTWKLPMNRQRWVGRDSVEPTIERSEASKASIFFRPRQLEMLAIARASCVGRVGSAECRPTKFSGSWPRCASLPGSPCWLLGVVTRSVQSLAAAHCRSLLFLLFV